MEIRVYVWPWQVGIDPGLSPEESKQYTTWPQFTRMHLLNKGWTQMLNPTIVPQMQVIVGWEWPEEGITKMQVPEHAQSNCFPLAYLHCQSSFTLFHCQLVLTQGNLTQ